MNRIVKLRRTADADWMKLSREKRSVMNTLTYHIIADETPQGDPTCSETVDNDCDGLPDTAEEPDCLTSPRSVQTTPTRPPDKQMDATGT